MPEKKTTTETKETEKKATKEVAEIKEVKERKKPVKKEKKEEKTEEKEEEVVKFSGKYIKAIGRRKTAGAQVRLYEKGKGNIVVNDKKNKEYFPVDYASVVTQSLKTIDRLRDFDISIIVKGGGVRAQAEAARHGIARTLLTLDEDLREVLKLEGFLTRDPRKKERKKPGLKKARKAPQWSKR